MLGIELLDKILGGSHSNVCEGFESSILKSKHDTFIKVFSSSVSSKMLVRKERILRALYFSKIYDNYQIIPKVSKLLYKKDGKFAGYIMEPVAGKRLDEFCKGISLADVLDIFENLEVIIKIVHHYDFCLTDFSPDNILVSTNHTIKLVDIDSFRLMNGPLNNILCNYKFTCPYSKSINKKHNIYCFYTLLLDTLYNVNKNDNTIEEILKKIMQDKSLPESIKEKLVYFANVQTSHQLSRLSYLF